MFTGLLIKEIIKDMDEQADKELHRVKSGRVTSAGASVSLELEHATFLAHECGHSPWISPKPHSSGIPVEALSWRHDWLLTPFLVPLPTLNNGKCDWKLWVYHRLVFWWLVSIQESTKGHLIWAKDALIIQEISTDLGALCQELVQRTNIKTKD